MHAHINETQTAQTPV